MGDQNEVYETASRQLSLCKLPSCAAYLTFPKLLAQLENYKLEHCSVTDSRSGALTAPKLVVVRGDIGRQFKNWTKL